MSEHDELQGQPEADFAPNAVIESNEAKAPVAAKVETEEQPEVKAKASESATDSEPEHEDHQDLTESARKAINRQHKKYQDERRERERLEKRLQELEEKTKPKPIEDVDIPPIPDDPWADDYQQRIAEREDAIRRKAKYEIQQEQARQAAETKRMETERKRLEEAERISSEFYDRASKSGINQKSLAEAERVLVDYGMSAELAQFILEDSDGPQMAVYLAENPMILDELGRESPIKAVMKLEREIRHKASALKRKSTAAPAPAETITGKGVRPKSELDSLFPNAVIE